MASDSVLFHALVHGRSGHVHGHGQRHGQEYGNVSAGQSTKMSFRSERPLALGSARPDGYFVAGVLAGFPDFTIDKRGGHSRRKRQEVGWLGPLSPAHRRRLPTSSVR